MGRLRIDYWRLGVVIVIAVLIGVEIGSVIGVAWWLVHGL